MGSIEFYQITLLIGIILLVDSALLFFQSLSTKKWIKVEATVIDSHISNYQSNDDLHVSYYPNIVYQYIIDGVIYKSKKIFYGDSFVTNFSFYAQKIANKYHKFKTIDIYYNSKNRSKAVIEPGVHFPLYLMLMASIVLILGSLFVWNNIVWQ
jgi:hypothetical protein